MGHQFGFILQQNSGTPYWTSALKLTDGCWVVFDWYFSRTLSFLIKQHEVIYCSLFIYECHRFRHAARWLEPTDSDQQEFGLNDSPMFLPVDYEGEKIHFQKVANGWMITFSKTLLEHKSDWWCSQAIARFSQSEELWMQTKWVKLITGTSVFLQCLRSVGGISLFAST